MNTSQIEYLAVAARTSSFAEAGRRLHVTPQAISKAIKALERECGSRLFIEEGKGVRPTAEALAIAHRAEPFLDSLADLQAFILCAEHRSIPSVTLGIATQGHRGSLLKSSDITTLTASVPDTHIELMHQTSGYCREAVAAGILDAALVPGAPMEDGIEGIRVGALHLNVVLKLEEGQSTPQSIALDRIAMRPIAHPFDISYVYRALALTLRELHPTYPGPFVHVEDEPGVYRSFLNRGGAILTLKGDEITNLSSEVVRTRLQPEPLPSLSTFLIFRKQQASRSIAKIAASLERILE